MRFFATQRRAKEANKLLKKQAEEISHINDPILKKQKADIHDIFFAQKNKKHAKKHAKKHTKHSKKRHH